MAIGLAKASQGRNYLCPMRSCSILLFLSLVLLVPRAGFAEEKTEASETEFRNWRIVGLVSMSGGVAFLATALAYRDRAQDNKSTYDRLIQEDVSWEDGQGQAFNNWQSSLNKKRITASVGVMALLSGSLLYYFSRSSDTANTSSIRMTPSASLDSSDLRAGLDLGINF